MSWDGEGFKRWEVKGTLGILQNPKEGACRCDVQLEVTRKEAGEAMGVSSWRVLTGTHSAQLTERTSSSETAGKDVKRQGGTLGSSAREKPKELIKEGQGLT